MARDHRDNESVLGPRPAPVVDEEIDEEADNIGNRIDPPANGRNSGRGPTLAEQDPYWQFGTPIESWGSTQGRKGGTVAGTGLTDSDPYWQFGTPPSSWGKSQQGQGPAHGRPRVYFECQRCGVKVERKAMHRGGASCPMCNRPMRQVGGQDPRDHRRPPARDQRPAPAQASVQETEPVVLEADGKSQEQQGPSSEE